MKEGDVVGMDEGGEGKQKTGCRTCSSSSTQCRGPVVLPGLVKAAQVLRMLACGQSAVS